MWHRGLLRVNLILEDDFIADTGPCYMEPDACMAKIEEDGRLLVCSSTQNVFHDLRMVCDITGLTEDQVHIVAATVGGGFGGKDGSTAQLFTALAAFKTRRPCKLISVVRNPWQQPINDMRSICM